MNKRIKEIRSDLGLTQEKFANELKLTKNYISLVESGERKLSRQAKENLCKTFHVSLEWLETGKGEKYNPALVINQLTNIFDDVAHDPNDSFRKSVFLGLSKLNPDEWAALKQIVEKIIGKKE